MPRSPTLLYTTSSRYPTATLCIPWQNLPRNLPFQIVLEILISLCHSLRPLSSPKKKGSGSARALAYIPHVSSPDSCPPDIQSLAMHKCLHVPGGMFEMSSSSLGRMCIRQSSRHYWCWRCRLEPWPTLDASGLAKDDVDHGPIRS